MTDITKRISTILNQGDMTEDRLDAWRENGRPETRVHENPNRFCRTCSEYYAGYCAHLEGHVSPYASCPEWSE